MKLFPLIQIHNMQTKPGSYYRRLLLSPNPLRQPPSCGLHKTGILSKLEHRIGIKIGFKDQLLAPQQARMSHFNRNGDFSAKIKFANTCEETRTSVSVQLSSKPAALYSDSLFSIKK